jgi:hypothetical protein
LSIVAAFAVACSAPPAPGGGARSDPGAAAYASAPAVGVAPLEPIAVYVDPGVARSAEVSAGVDGWRVATFGIREWRTADTADAADVTVYQVGRYARVCEADETTDALGCVQAIGGLWDRAMGDPMNVFLVEGNYEADAALVTMHEIGHLLGLTHGAGLMAADVAGAWQCPDAETIDRLSELTGVDGFTACEAP